MTDRLWVGRGENPGRKKESSSLNSIEAKKWKKGIRILT
jgi:hypothetical protein